MFLVRVDPFVEKNMGPTDKHSWLIRLLPNMSQTEQSQKINLAEFGSDIAEVDTFCKRNK